MNTLKLWMADNGISLHAQHCDHSNFTHPQDIVHLQV